MAQLQLHSTTTPISLVASAILTLWTRACAKMKVRIATSHGSTVMNSRLSHQKQGAGLCPGSVLQRATPTPINVDRPTQASAETHALTAIGAILRTIRPSGPRPRPCAAASQPKSSTPSVVAATSSMTRRAVPTARTVDGAGPATKTGSLTTPCAGAMAPTPLRRSSGAALAPRTTMATAALPRPVTAVSAAGPGSPMTRALTRVTAPSADAETGGETEIRVFPKSRKMRSEMVSSDN